MSPTAKTASVKLVTIISPSEFAESLAKELLSLGVTGYTWTTAEGRGIHGPRHRGIVEANVRLEVVTQPALARKILDLVATTHADDAMLAYAMDVEAVPQKRFA